MLFSLFEPTIIFFGITNSPATFQNMMDMIFSQMINKNLLIIYMDNILIYTPTLKELDK